MKKIRLFLFAFLFFACFFSIPARASPDDLATWEEVRFGGIVEQGLDNSCGLASLLTIIRTHFGDERYDEASLLKKYMEEVDESALAESMKNGLSLLELEKLARSLGYDTVKKTLVFPALVRLSSFVPVLVYLEVGKLRHFAIVRGASEDAVFLGDPSRGNVEYSREEFLSEWETQKGDSGGFEKTGVALILIRREGAPAGNLLKEPPSNNPPSFVELERQMLRR